MGEFLQFAECSVVHTQCGELAAQSGEAPGPSGPDAPERHPEAARDLGVGQSRLGQDERKQVLAQPYDNSLYCCPILYMGASSNQWKITSNNGNYWYFPAQRNVWTRFLFDVTYSADPQRGSLQVSADLNADGDFDDAEERMPRIRTNTLISETDGPNGTSDGLGPGDSIPSHLRAGIYHNASIPCPPPNGCADEIDNVQVMAP